MSVSAQNLPPAILEFVITCVSGVERALGHRIGTKRCYVDRSFLPFLAVCGDWRVYAKSLFYQEALALVNDECVDLQEHTHMLPSLTDAIEADTTGLVKVAHIELPYSRVIDGMGASFFASGHFKDAQFASATQLLLVLNDNMYPRAMDGDTMTTNVAEFSAAISRLFPNVRDHLVYIGCYEYAPQREYLVDMIPAICGQSSGVSISDLSHGIYEQVLLLSSSLKHIMFRSDYYTDAQMELIRRNSQTLECIHLLNIDSEACLKIVQDSAGQLVVYPHVWKLELLVKDRLNGKTSSCPPGAPFPLLTALACSGMYPFADGCLVRGNSKTLTSISLPITPYLATALSNVSNFPALRDISLYWRGKSRRDREEIAEQAISLAFGSSPNIEKIELDVEYTADYSAILNIAHESLATQTIQILDILSTPLTYLDVIQLVSSLPNLARLSLMLAHEAPLNARRGITADNIKQIHDEHYPVFAQRLFLLRIVSLFGVTYHQMAERAILLCTLIPSMKRAVVSLDRRTSNFEAVTSKLLKRKGFREHNSRLSNVRFIEE